MRGCGCAAGGALSLDKQDSPAVQQLVTRELLHHPWISCEGASCRDVGTRPGSAEPGQVGLPCGALLPGPGCIGCGCVA